MNPMADATRFLRSARLSIFTLIRTRLLDVPELLELNHEAPRGLGFVTDDFDQFNHGGDTDLLVAIPRAIVYSNYFSSGTD